MRRWRVCIVSTSRADYGGLVWLAREVQDDSALELQLAVVGDHWASDPARRAARVTDDGAPVALVVEATPRNDQAASIGAACATALEHFAAALPALAPDVVIVLGDRFELMAPALAATVHGIPLAHIHGGELSLGAIDNDVRHALTKLAKLHFVATGRYAARVVQMGEPEESVFCVGAPALDGIKAMPPMSRRELERETGASFDSPVLLVTYHPVTREPGSAREQVAAVLDAVARSGRPAILTTANADVDGATINAMMAAFAGRDPRRYRLFEHLGQRRYFGCLRHCAAMLGNSSSGLVEAPAFELPVVNVGNRQEGRVRAANVIDANVDADEILAALGQALDPGFRRRLHGMANPYDPHGDGRTSWRIKELLKSALSAGLAPRKRFQDSVPAEAAP